MNKNILIVLGLVFLGILGILFFAYNKPVETTIEPIDERPAPIAITPTSTHDTIGQSVEGRAIDVYTFGTGDTNLLFVGGVHGGYEWNSSALAYEMVDYFAQNETVIPNNVTLHIIPNLNPDGLYLATGLEGKFATTDITDYSMHTNGVGRFNGNNVDLNRNFDCRWVATGTWRGNTVSGGTGPFSEPEAAALRDYVANISPEAAVFWHSKAGNVYGAECNGGEVDVNTLTLMSTYATASGYGEVPVFDAYTVTGAAEDWLTSIGVPAVSVELTSRTSSEREQNLAGITALLDLYGK